MPYTMLQGMRIDESQMSPGAGMRFAGDLLNSGTRHLALIHQRAGHAHDFLTVALEVQRLKLKLTLDADAQGRN